MRIISKFHDYYDAGMAEGQDRSLVYVRKSEKWEGKLLLGERPIPAEVSRIFDWVKSRCPGNVQFSKSGKYQSVDLHYGAALFAGLIYPYALVTRRPFDKFLLPERQFIYDFDTLQGVFVELRYKLEFLQAKKRYFGAPIPAAETYFNRSGSNELSAHCLEHSFASVNVFTDPGKIELNPRLMDVELFRKLNTWQAFQELSMFLGNIAAPDHTPITVSEKDRVNQHGFDEWSFRKMPTPCPKKTA